MTNWNKLLILHNIDSDDASDLAEFCLLAFGPLTMPLEKLEFIYRLWINEP